MTETTVGIWKTCSYSDFCYRAATSGYTDLIIGLALGFFLGILSLFLVRERYCFGRTQQIGGSKFPCGIGEKSRNIYGHRLTFLHPHVSGIIAGLIINMSFGIMVSGDVPAQSYWNTHLLTTLLGSSAYAASVSVTRFNTLFSMSGLIFEWFG